MFKSLEHFLLRARVLFLIAFLSACAVMSAEERRFWAESYNPATQARFIPVELFTGASWDGKHELRLKEVSTFTCGSADGKKCDNYFVTGPFQMENKFDIPWAGKDISYYRRTYTTPRRSVEQYFTINKSRDGLVRIYDARTGRPDRTYSGRGSKFPLGYWKQGEVRTYENDLPVRIEIEELNGPGYCLTFRWTYGSHDDNSYTFCPGKGLTSIRHRNPH